MGHPECRLCGVWCKSMLEQGEYGKMLCCNDRELDFEEKCEPCQDSEPKELTKL